MADMTNLEAVQPIVKRYRSNSLSGMSLTITSNSARQVSDVLESIARCADDWRSLYEKSNELNKRMRSTLVLAYAAGFGIGLCAAAILEVLA